MYHEKSGPLNSETCWKNKQKELNSQAKNLRYTKHKDSIILFTWSYWDLIYRYHITIWLILELIYLTNIQLSKRISTKKITPRYITVKLLKTNNKEKILKYNIFSKSLPFTHIHCSPSLRIHNININNTKTHSVPLFALSCIEYCNLNYVWLYFHQFLSNFYRKLVKDKFSHLSAYFYT